MHAVAATSITATDTFGTLQLQVTPASHKTVGKEEKTRYCAQDCSSHLLKVAATLIVNRMNSLF